MQLDEEQIDINDIAHSLALLCRFNGHCLTFYSVAEHCIQVADLVGEAWANYYLGIEETMNDEDFNRDCLAALLHDAAEAYIGDMCRGPKSRPMFKEFRELEKQILGKVIKKYNCTGVNWELIERMDGVALATEAKWNMADSGKGWHLPESPILPLLPLPERVGNVESLFLFMFRQYGGTERIT
ncbi:hypothetical protein LCGC14_0947350 [marine sediment metagenome]|uniref:HD domain-containing protein n=1 Tax=marine sediment metagenome TaxID=412755 RepID=A0A0F9NIF9_9ZZZZ